MGREAAACVRSRVLECPGARATLATWEPQRLSPAPLSAHAADTAEWRVESYK